MKNTCERKICKTFLALSVRREETGRTYRRTMRYPVFVFLFCAAAWILRADSFQYDDSGRLFQATQSNGLVHNYTTDDEGSLLTAASSSTDTTAGGGPGNGIPDWWENFYFGTSGIDPKADGGDGVPYLMKFALGLDPTQNVTPGQLPAGIVEGSNMSLIFRVGKDAVNLVYTVQSSPDLMGAWTDLTAETDAALALPPLFSDGTSDSYKVTVPMEGDKFFMRLKVSAQ